MTIFYIHIKIQKSGNIAYVSHTNCKISQFPAKSGNVASANSNAFNKRNYKFSSLMWSSMCAGAREERILEAVGEGGGAARLRGGAIKPRFVFFGRETVYSARNERSTYYISSLLSTALCYTRFYTHYTKVAAIA